MLCEWNGIQESSFLLLRLGCGYTYLLDGNMETREKGRGSPLKVQYSVSLEFNMDVLKISSSVAPACTGLMSTSVLVSVDPGDPSSWTGLRNK